MYTFFDKFCRSKRLADCKDAVDSIEFVTSCPTSKNGWERAANKKNCSAMASLWGNCTANGHPPFVYHCLVDEQRTKLLEVCAPDILIIGNPFSFFFVFLITANEDFRLMFQCFEYD